MVRNRQAGRQARALYAVQRHQALDAMRASALDQEVCACLPWPTDLGKPQPSSSHAGRAAEQLRSSSSRLALGLMPAKLASSAPSGRPGQYVLMAL